MSPTVVKDFQDPGSLADLGLVDFGFVPDGDDDDDDDGSSLAMSQVMASG